MMLLGQFACVPTAVVRNEVHASNGADLDSDIWTSGD